MFAVQTRVFADQTRRLLSERADRTKSLHSESERSQTECGDWTPNVSPRPYISAHRSNTSICISNVGVRRPNTAFADYSLHSKRKCSPTEHERSLTELTFCTPNVSVRRPNTAFANRT